MVSERAGVDGLLEHFFRHQYGRSVARLTRVIGRDHLDLAEASVQEALTKALRLWPTRGVPDDPAAWILSVARNHALDVCRRDTRWHALVPLLKGDLSMVATAPVVESRFEGELSDDTLAMMFMCCHPCLSPQARVSLTLKVVSGFGVDEIARAFLAAPTTIAQRVVRAKQRLRDEAVAMVIPPPEALEERLDSVLDVIYLIFNEGYSCHDTAEVVRMDLIDESLRLIGMLTRHPSCARPHAHALAAMICFQASRVAARVDQAGMLLPLEDQDRALWDTDRIEAGLAFLARAGGGTELTEFHLLAGIAACHATARTSSDTNWLRIAGLYDRLVQINGTFVNQLGRAIAYARVEGPEVGLRMLDALTRRQALKDYHRAAAVRADCLWRLGHREEARVQYAHAATLARSAPERRFFEARAASLSTGD